MVWRTVHVNHAKPAKAPPGGFPVPTAPATSAISPPKYSSRNLSWRKPPPPQPAAPVAEPSQPHAPAHPASPSLSRPTARSSTNQEAAPLPEQRSPPPQPRANENSRSDPPLRRSERLKANRPIDRPTQAAPAHSQPSINMARTFPYSLSYDACIGDEEQAYNFSSIYLEVIIQCPGLTKPCPGMSILLPEKNLLRYLSPRLVMCACARPLRA